MKHNYDMALCYWIKGVSCDKDQYGTVACIYLQYMFDITDTEDEPMFHLMQKTTRSAAAGQENSTIGFTIFRVWKIQI